jgi:hypothetical protein
MGPGRSKLKYKVHRAIDEKYEVITATDVSAGEKNEAHLLIPLVDQIKPIPARLSKPQLPTVSMARSTTI